MIFSGHGQVSDSLPDHPDDAVLRARLTVNVLSCAQALQATMPRVYGRHEQQVSLFEAPHDYSRRLDGSMIVPETGEGSDARLARAHASRGVPSLEPMVSTLRVFGSLSREV